MELLLLQDPSSTYQPNTLPKQHLLLSGDKTAEYHINVALAVCTESVCCVIIAQRHWQADLELKMKNKDQTHSAWLKELTTAVLVSMSIVRYI